MAWFMDERDLTQNEESAVAKLTLREGINIKGKLGVSQCPGKKIERGRDGKCYDRNIY